MLKIAVGSTSPHKLLAVRSVVKELGIKARVRGVRVSSGVNEQPVGFEETYGGAITRASRALNRRKSPDLSIGIESGIFRYRASSITIDFAVVAVFKSDGRIIVSTSPGLMLPEHCVRMAHVQGFDTTTVGSVVAKLFGGDPTDPYSTLTNGKFTRAEGIAMALKIALSQI